MNLSHLFPWVFFNVIHPRSFDLASSDLFWSTRHLHEQLRSERLSLQTLVLHLHSGQWRDTAANTYILEAMKLFVLKSNDGNLGGVARPGPHYLCIHLCSHWNNSGVPDAPLPLEGASPPLCFAGLPLIEMSRWKPPPPPPCFAKLNLKKHVRREFIVNLQVLVLGAWGLVSKILICFCVETR